MKKQALDFVVPHHSKALTWVANKINKFYFSRHFRHVWLSEKYAPDDSKSTVYFMNHGLWWDPIICLLLNELVFKQQALYLGDERILQRRPILSRLGGVPMSGDPSKTEYLRYLVSKLREPGVGLYMYPEGKVNGGYDKELEFKNGLAWISLKCPEVEFVPVAITPHLKFTPKPQLFLAVGEKCKFPKASQSLEERTLFLQKTLQDLLNENNSLARNPNHTFDRLL